MTAKNIGLLEYLDKTGVTLPHEVVVIPEWEGRKVTLRGFTSRERDLFEADNLRRATAKMSNGARKRGAPTEADLTNFRARLVARTIIEDGVRTFATPEAEEILGNQPATILDRLFSVAQRLNGMSDTDVEELAGESAATAEREQSTASRGSSGEPSQKSSVN